MRPADVTCAWVRDAAPEFVLGTLDGVQRADLVDHVAACAACREEVATLSSAMNDLALLAPDMAPSADFEAGVLGAMTADRRIRLVDRSDGLDMGASETGASETGASETDAAGEGGRQAPRWRSSRRIVRRRTYGRQMAGFRTGTPETGGHTDGRRTDGRHMGVPLQDGPETIHPAMNTRWTTARLVSAIAVAAVVVLVLVIGGIHLARPTSSGPTTAPMISADGRRIGESSVVRGTPDVVTVTVSYPFPGSDYALEGVGDGGTVVHIGAMHLRDGVWRWSGKLKADAAGVRVLRIVTPSGYVVCQGSLPQ